MSAASLAASVPRRPMATPMCAALSAGTSLTPSPVIAAISPSRLSASTIRTLCSGTTRAKTSTRRVVSRSASGESASSCGPVTTSTGPSPCATPVAAATLAAVRGWSPVIMIVRTPAVGPRRRSPARSPAACRRARSARAARARARGRRPASRSLGAAPRAGPADPAPPTRPQRARARRPRTGRRAAPTSTSGAPFTHAKRRCRRRRRARRSCACARSRTGASTRRRQRARRRGRCRAPRPPRSIASSSGSACSCCREASSAASSRSSSATPGAGPSRCTARRFSVSVPVLSLQMTVVEPSVSTAASRRTIAPCSAIWRMLSASVIVTTAGRPSGSAATASDTPTSTLWASVSPWR